MFFISAYITHMQAFCHRMDQSCLLLQHLVKLTLQGDPSFLMPILGISAKTLL